MCGHMSTIGELGKRLYMRKEKEKGASYFLVSLGGLEESLEEMEERDYGVYVCSIDVDVFGRLGIVE